MFCKCLLYMLPPPIFNMFNMRRHLQKCFTDVLQHFCKRFTLKHLKNILRGAEVVKCKIKC